MDQFEQYDKGSLLRDRYLKISDISEGSYGLVSVAKDTKVNNRLVAVKFIYPLDYKKNRDKIENASRPSSSPAKLKSQPPPKGLTDDDIDVEEEEDGCPKSGAKQYRQSVINNLLNEAQKEIKIHKILGDHPNISTLIDHFDSCLVLEFCTRGDLYEAIHNGNGPATTQDIKDVFQQVLNAVEFCHSHGVYHRDLKPENILIAEDWSIKLCDWGLSTTTRYITNKDEFDIGSERYMAPELFDNNLESYDASKIDIWSLGIILLTLVFHKNPFQVANYSDKRFIQFVNNREALFDIFSTMSGDLFSILRFSLTIDPNNRDLNNIHQELKSLRYFTIDEEYWASDYEEEQESMEEEEEGPESMEEDDGYFDNESDEKVSPEERIPKKSPLLISSPDSSKLDQYKPKDVAPSVSITNVDVDAEGTTTNNNNTYHPNSYTHASKPYHPRPRTPDIFDEIPHNHRADALLSSNTHVKPIPISGSGFKFIRNTRKPLNVASYNQNSHMNFNRANNNSMNNKFNREDFFTPKSVFNHYLDKYGEQKFGKLMMPNRDNGFINGNDSRGGDQKKYQYATRTWKKNYKKKYNKYCYANNSPQQYHRGGNDYSTNNDSHNHYHGNRRKSRLYSTSKLRRSYYATSGTTSNPPSAGPSTNLSASIPVLHHPSPLNGSVANNGNITTANGTTTNSNNLSTSGKYIPPYLRSPNYQKSPVIEPLMEEMDHLSLGNDYDEVFHLEDDFDLLKPSNGNGYSSNNDSPSTYHNFPHHHRKNSSIDNRNNNGINTTGRKNSISAIATRKAIFGDSITQQPNGNHMNIGASSSAPLSTSASSTTSGKYIPPFRRASIVAANNLKRSPPDGRKDININKACHENNNNTTTPGGHGHGGHGTGNGVSLIGSQWITTTYKKDWSDYDD